MTVSTQENIVKYQGNPSTTVYQIPFRWLEDTDINIQKQLQDGTVEVLTYLTDYTLTGENDEHGGYATFTVAPLATDTIVIQRVVPYTQETDYEENEVFPADSHEEALDKLTMEVQQLAEESSRALKISVFSTVDPEDVINHVERVYESIDNIDTISKDLSNVDIVADNIDSVNTVAEDIDSVITTATNVEDVKTVAQNKASLNITAANIADVNTVAKDITSVKTTADNIEDVKTNATNITDINTNAVNIGSINQVADIRNNVTLVALNNKKVTTVAENIDNVNVVANNITNVVRTGASIDNVNTVAGDIANVNTVAGAITDVDQVAMIKDEVKKVGDNIGDVMTVAGIDEQVTTVANNANAVKEIGDNIDVVLKSPTYANNAKTWSEGTDTEVGSLGGTHSAKGWAEIAAQVSQVNPADETTAGIIRIATMEEAEAGIADTAAITPLKAKAIADEYTGKVVQLGFNGTLSGDTLTFVPDQEAYVIKAGYEYEVDLLFPAAGVLPDATKMVITNGEDTINIVNVKDADASTPMTYGAMKQMCRYDAEVGWRWIFNARYAVTDTGVKVLVMPSAVIDDSRYATTDTAQNITAGKNFVNNATSTTTDAHTGMSICLKNSQSDITANTQNEDGSVDFKYQGIRFVDKNNEETGFIYNAPDGVGGSFTRVGTSAKVDGQYVDSFIEMEVDANGKGHVYLPTVDEDATVSGNQAATVDYVKDKSGSLSIMDVVFAPLGIDESKNKRRYLNGQVIIQSQFPAFTSAVKARMTTMANAFTTETNWQAEKTNSKLGQCGKFVVDDTAGTIRLPCVVNAQGLVDLAQIGGIKNESLPNITGATSLIKMAGKTSGATGAFTEGTHSTSVAIQSGSIDDWRSLYLNASLSSSTYQDNAPVQQEAVQYPYVIVVNTGVEEAERPINNYQVNNVYSYGMSQYYKGDMNNLSWLKSAGQWNSSTVYAGMYNWLVEQVNAGKSGFVASTATYTDYDFVINTTDQTFRLPLLNGQEGIFADGVKGNGLTLGLTNGTEEGCLILDRTDATGSFFQIGKPSSVGQPLGTTDLGTGSFTVDKTFGVTTDSSKSGMVVDKTIPSGYNLYYYVGDTLQNASLINVARIEEKLTDVNAASRGYLVESYRNGTEWYRVYSDGWIEQGGEFTQSSPFTLTFPKAFTTTSYVISLNASDMTPNDNMLSVTSWNNKTATGVKIYISYNGTAVNNQPCDWIAFGY